MTPARLERIWKKTGHGDPMVPLETAVLETGHGMVGDVNHAASRPITVIEGDAWDRAQAVLGDTVDPGARRANLMVRGVSLEECRGKVLRVGACRIRFRGETRPCHVMDEAREGLRAALAEEWRGGAFGDVLEGGPVTVGDAVAWESGPESGA